MLVCPFAMIALRRFFLVFCLAPLCWPAGVVLAAQPAAQTQAGKAQAPSKAVKKQAVRKPASKKARQAKAVAKPLPKANLDLSLPTEMVETLTPNVGTNPSPIKKRKPLLPPMFAEKPEADSPFQLNGRLISNEMQLQLRNDSRRDVEGAAIDFQYRQ